MRTFAFATTACSLLASILTSSANVTVQGWWHYGEVPGDYYFDSSGNGHRFGMAFSRVGSGNAGAGVQPFGCGGPLGNTSFISTNCLFWTPTHADAAGMWNPGFNPPATNYGLELWALPQYPGSLGGNGAWLFGSGSSGGIRIAITNDPSDGSMVIRAYNIGNNTLIGDPWPVDTNRWTHLAVVNNGGTNIFYVNGVQKGIADVGHATVPAGDIFAGSAPGTQPTFVGYLDELRIFSFSSGQFSTNDLLTRSPAPNIIQPPQSAGVWQGGAAPFTVGVAFDTSTTYQWRRGGVPTGATGSEYYLSTVAPSDNGAQIDVVLNNISGLSTTSSVATLSVVPVQTANVNFYRSAVQAESGLVAYFPADGNTGSTLSNTKDASHNGTLEGGAEYDGRTNRSFGERAVSLNANGDVTIPNNTAYEFGSGTGTIEALVYLGRAVSAVPETIFALAADGGGPIYYQIMASADGTSLIYTNDSQAQSVSWSLSPPLVGRLAHMAVVFTNQTVTAYVDGLSLGSKPNPNFGSSPGLPAYIGSWGPNNPGLWTGTIDEVAVYSTALSDSTIAVHNSRFVYGTNVTSPSITSGPGGSKTLLAGGSPTFTVTAAGTAPLSYQWYRNASPISGATSATLTLSQTTTGSSGDYFVRVSNPIGSVDSSHFTLTFNAAADTHSAKVMTDNPSAYWRLDEASGSTAFDVAGGHDGSYLGSLTRGQSGALPGLSDNSVNFTGGNVEVPYSATLNPSTPFTVEFFARPSAQNTYVPICSQFRNGAGRSGWCFYQFNDTAGFEAHLGNPSGVTMFTFANNPQVPVAGQWYHVALVYDGINAATLYVEGIVEATASGNYVPNPSAPLEIGVRNGGALAWNGGLDEVAIYNYALSANQISNHWASKFAPSQITQQPAGVTNSEGSTITLTAVVSGFPNSYQWFKDGVALSPSQNFDGSAHYAQDVTNASLVISQSVPTDSGLYHVVVSNPLGGSTSANAKVLVTANTNPPSVASVLALGTANQSGPTPYLIKVLFSNRVDPTTGGDLTKYSINPPVTINSVKLLGSMATDVTAARLGGDWRAAYLVTAGLTPGQKYSVTVNGVKDQSQTQLTIPTTTTYFRAPLLTAGVLDWDYYYLGSGGGVANLLANANFPDAPQTNVFMTAFDSGQITGGDLANNPNFGSLGENYGSVLSGWITPTVSGDYTFFLASDDASELDLSLDAYPSNAVMIAQEPGCCHGFTEPPVPYTSAPQTLQAGVPYYIRAYHVEGGGGDYVKVAWRLSTDSTPAPGLPPIQSSVLSAYKPVPPPQLSAPVLSGGNVTISWTGYQAILQQSTDLVNWTAVPGNPNPLVVPVNSAPRKFYRLIQ